MTITQHPGYAVPPATTTPWTLDVLGDPAIAFHAFGQAAPQGSKNSYPIYRGSGEDRVFTGKTRVVESSAKVAPWRDAVSTMARVAISKHRGWVPLDGPLVVDMVFTMEKGSTLPKWKAWHDVTPDLDKLARSTGDALSKVVWVDDARVTGYRRLDAVYVGADDPDVMPLPGAVIRVWRVPAELIEARKAATRRRT